MGFAKRMVRKSVRKATPRSVHKVLNPIGAIKSAVTPRPIKQLSRGIYTVTNPLGAAENALTEAMLSPGGGRRRSGGARRRSSGSSRPSGTRAPSSAAQAKTQQAYDAHEALSSLMAAGRARFQPSARPVLPAAARTDPAPLEAAEWAARKGQASVWRRAERKRLRLEAAAAARAAADQRDRELAEQTRRRQADANAWWERLSRGEEQPLTTALKEAFTDNAAPVDIIRAEKTEAALVLRLPGPGILPERKAHVTPGGKATTNAWTKTELAEVYADLLGAHLLATLRESWAVAPSLRDIRVIGVRGRGLSAEVLFDVEASRDAASRGDGHGRVLLEESTVGLRRSGRTREVAPWPPAELDPEVAALAC